jgi:hypothetical protein
MGFLVSSADGATHQLALADGGTLQVQSLIPGGDTAPTRIYTGNTESTLSSVGFAPTSAGAPLLAIDFTPQASGLIEFQGTLVIGSSVAEAIQLVTEYVPNLTAITGGTILAGTTPAGAVHIGPTSTTPADTTGAIVMAQGGTTVLSNGQNAILITIAVTFQAVKGQRSALVLRGLTATNTTTWAVGGNLRLQEAA